MHKVRIVGHESERDRTLTILQDLGVLQISDLTTANEQTLNGFRPHGAHGNNEIESRLADLRYVLDFLARYDTEKPGFIQSFFNLKKLIRLEEIEQIAREYDYRGIYQQARQLDQESIELRSERAQLEARRAELLPWAELPIPLEELRATATTDVVLGRVPKEKIAEFIQAVELSEAAVVQLAGEDKQSKYFCAFVLRDSQEAFLSVLTEHGGERMNIPAVSARGLPKEILAQIESRIREIDVRQHQITQKATTLIAEKPKLQALYDYLYNEHLKAQAQARLLSSSHAFVLEGWVRASDLGRLEHALKNNSEAVYMERIDPDPHEVPPVALENRRLFRPAEFLIKLFGLPHQRELDPTPFVLPFFAIFFGIALTDAGYGLALILIFAYLKRRYRHKLGFQPFANLMILGGISAVIAGALTGGWFGSDLKEIITVLRDRVMIFNVGTQQGLIAFLLFSLGMGFLHVLLGNLLEIYDKIRTGRLWEALWSDGSWVLFITGIGIAAGAGVPMIMPKELNAPGLPSDWMPVGATLALMGALLVVCFGRVENPHNLSEQWPWLMVALGLFLWLQKPLAGVPVGEIVAVLGVIGVLVLTQRGMSLGAKVRAVLGRIGAGLFKLYGVSGLLGDVLSYSRIMALGISTGLIADAINKLAKMLLGFPAVGIVISIVFVIFGQIFSLLINSLSAFVHSARLHYVEFFTKFYEAGGATFRPFTRESVYYEIQKSEELSS